VSWNEDDNNQMEQFLKTELDNYKIYPEEKVWNLIYKEFHGYKRWHALTIVSFIILTALTLSTLQFNNTIKLNLLAKSNKTIYYLNKLEPSKTNLISENIIPKQKEFIYSKKEENILHNLVYLPKKSIITSSNKITTSVYPLKNLYTNFIHFSYESNLPITQINQLEEEEISSLFTYTTNNNYGKLWAGLFSEMKNIPEDKSIPKNTFILKQELVKQNNIETNFKLLPNKPKKSKLELQFYVTPSISFRRLKDDKSRNIITSRSTNTPQPLPAVYYVDINDVVKHKPALGLEAGVGFLYKVAPKVKLKAGLQFNTRKYYIDSYKDGLNIAQIAVLTSNGLDTINQFATSSTTGISNKSLKNSIYQTSIPLGIQWQILQSKKFEISLEASVQPTLTLNKNVYLISTDYKFYTNGNSFFRKWNINTGLDINFTYKIGNYSFFISPQIRYQHLPTYTDKYPIKEYRLDNGLRIGFTKEIF
jgi:hypothetical protein